MSDVSIRPYRASDLDAMLEAIGESVAEVGAWMPWCHPGYSKEDGQNWMAEQIAAFQNHAAFEFAVISEDGGYCGGCGVNQIERDSRRANLGYWVRSSMTRRGIAAAAVRLVRDWAFEHTDLIRLEVVVAVENVASRHVAEKTGAFCEGVLRNRFLLHGRAHDAVIYAFTRTPEE